MIIQNYIDRKNFSWCLKNVEYLGKGKKASDNPRDAIAYDKTLLQDGNGTYVLFLDCSVRFITLGRLKELGIRPGEAVGSSEFSVTLANGVKVELLGVCDHPSEGKRWWRPDGNLLSESPYDDDFGRAFPKESEKGYKFAVKFSGMAGGMASS